MIQVFHSDKNSGSWLIPQEPIPFSQDLKGQEMQMIMVYPDITYQTIDGFGGALTPASAEVFGSMRPEKQKELLALLFGKDGLAYTCGRNSIGACDFSDGQYSYCEKEGDLNLESFSVEMDENYVIPFLQKANTYMGKKMTLLSSPWSPPAWIKTNKNMLQGGKLMPEFYATWANYFVKYIQAYAQKGIPVDYVTVQNEPQAVQRWESCIYTAEDEKLFIRDYLYPALVEAKLEQVKIILWDHNKESLFSRARTIMADERVHKMVHGFAFHWYSGDHFENLQLCKEFYPDKELIFTEGCVELTTTATTMAKKTNQGGNSTEVSHAPWEFGESYGHDILGNLNNGMNLYMDWNVILDQQGGPNHVGNYCSAPIICHPDSNQIFLQPSFYFISHFSRFVPQGSKRIANSRYTNELEVFTAITLEGKKVAVIMNPTQASIPFILKDMLTNQIANIQMESKSIKTLVW